MWRRVQVKREREMSEKEAKRKTEGKREKPFSEKGRKGISDSDIEKKMDEHQIKVYTKEITKRIL